MSPDERSVIDRLDDDLDRIVATSTQSGGYPTGGTALTDAHRRVQALDDTPGPSSDFVRRLMEDLMHATAFPISNGRPTMNGAERAEPVRSQLMALQRPIVQQYWRPLRLAAAALILLAIGGVVLGFDQLDHRPRRNPVIPAAMAPESTPTTTADEETLLDIELPAELLPHGDRVLGALDHVTIPPGTTTWDAESGRCCPGVRVDLVLTGGYSVTSGDAPLLISRAGSDTSESVEAGTTVDLNAGDAVAFPNAASIEYENPGAGTVNILNWIFVDTSKGSYSTDPFPVGWTITKLDLRDEVAFTDGPGRLRVRRLDLPANSKTDPAGLQWAVSLPLNEAGTPVPPMLYVRTDGQLSNDGDTVLPVYVVNLESSGMPVSTPESSPTA